MKSVRNYSQILTYLNMFQMITLLRQTLFGRLRLLKM